MVVKKGRIAKAVLQTKKKPTIKSLDLVKPVPSKLPRFAPNSDGKRYWLVKSEPMRRIDSTTGKDVSFPLSSLLHVESEPWDGVRNYELRNSMLQMSVGDIAFFYHSNCPVPGIVGMVTIAGELKPDESQFDNTRQYFDPKSTRENPKWWCVDVKFMRRFRHKVTLVDLKLNEKLQEFLLVKRGRLSVIPVSEDDYEEIMRMEQSGDVKDDIDCDVDKSLIDPK